jgi:hypothetical protein
MEEAAAARVWGGGSVTERGRKEEEAHERKEIGRG